MKHRRSASGRLLSCDNSTPPFIIRTNKVVIQSSPFSILMSQRLEIKVTYNPCLLLLANCPTHYQRIVTQLPQLPKVENHSPCHPTLRVIDSVARLTHIHMDIVEPLSANYQFAILAPRHLQPPQFKVA